MKKVILFLFIVAFISCKKDYIYKQDYSILAGSWYGVLNNNLVNLNLKHSGDYDYTEFTSDSVFIYSESGTWQLQYLQVEKVSKVDLDLPNDLIFEVNESSKPENIGVKTYLEFEYFDDETLEIYLNDNETLTLQR
jgi:hypothetical protein